MLNRITKTFPIHLFCPNRRKLVVGLILGNFKSQDKKVRNGKKAELSQSVSTNASEFDEESTRPPPSAPPRDLLSDSESTGKVSKNSDYELEENNDKSNLEGMVKVN